MPSVSATLPTAEDKEIVKRFIPKSSNKIFMATVARLYVAYPDSNAWTYTNIMGAVVFSADSKKNSLFFRIVDLLNNGGILWEQELYEGFLYDKERSFFHTFTTDDYLAAFSFANENEADVFFAKVTKHIAKKVKQQKEQKPKKKEKNGKITTSMISKPSDFRHLGHIGWNPESGYDAQNIDPKWKNILNTLGDLGVPKSVIESNSDFIMQFVENNGGIKKTTPLPKSPTSKKVPPTPPPPKQKRPAPIKSKEKPPPPPVPARKSMVAPSISTEDSSPSHSPPIVPRKSVPSSPSLPPKQSSPRQVPKSQPPILHKQFSPPIIPSIPKSRQPSPPPVVSVISKSRQPSPPPVVSVISKSRQPSPPPVVSVISKSRQPSPPPVVSAVSRSRQPSPPPIAPIIPKSRQPSPPPVQVAPPPPPPPVRSVAPPPLPPARVVPSLNKQEGREVPRLPPARIIQTEVSQPPPPSGGPPPPPPPPPPSSGGPPPPPPPPSSGGPPPPPLPPMSQPSNAAAPAPLEGRTNLLAQIRSVGGASGAGLKPVSQTPPSRQSTVSEEPSSPTSGGNDLLKTLANALMNRQQALNDYSDEEEDDEEWGDDE